MAWARAMGRAQLANVTRRQVDQAKLTRSRSVLAAEVAGLVASQKAGRFDLRSSTTGEAGVEVHHTVHTGSILSSTDRLLPMLVTVV